LKLFTGRMREVPIIVWIISAVFLFRFFYLSGGH
jgi:AGZA family xanthine/uracil permease-like MFS transporter